MRIDRLDLIAFGPFTNTALDFSKGSEGLHLVYGPNEAGKSSALRAIQQFFRGIETRSTDNFVHQYGNMKIGAVLRDRAGESIELIRRKGTKNTLLRPDGSALDNDESRLARILGGVSPEEFLRTYVIDHDKLGAGGKAVVEGRGELGQALFSGSGVLSLGPVRKALEEEAEALFKRGGTKPSINFAAAALEAERKKIKDDALKSSDWLNHDQTLRDARARKDSLQREHDAARRERNRLGRFAEALDPIARRRAVLDELATLSDVPRLAPKLTLDRRDALMILKTTEPQEAEHRRSIAELTRSLEDLEVPEALLEEADAIDALHLRLGSRRQAARERTTLESERDQAEAEVRSIRLELGLDVDNEAGLDAFRLKAADRALIQDLAASRQALLQAVEKARKDLEKHARKRAEAASKLAALGPDRDPSALRKAIKQAQSQGDLEARLAESRENLARDERRGARALDALGHWSGPLDAVEGLAVPSVETIEQFKDLFKHLADAEAALRKRLDAFDGRARQAVAELAALRLAGDVPTEDDLLDARRRRDDAWQHLKQARAWDVAVADEFERAANRADELADRLRREAARVSERARLMAEPSRLDADRDDLRGQIDQSRTRLEAANSQWLGVWAALGITAPGTPREMLAWLHKHASLATLAQSVRETRETVHQRVEQAAGHRRLLHRALADLGEPRAVDNDDEPLASLIERADETVDAARKRASDRKRLTEDLENSVHDQTALEQTADSSKAEWERWQTSWAAAMTPINLPPDALPAQANAVLDRTARLFERLDQARAHRRKLVDGEREAAQFDADVRTLAARVAPDLVPTDGTFEPDRAASELAARLIRARADRQKRDSLTEQRTRQEQAARTARDTIARARGTLDALCQEAGCRSVDELPAVEERSARRLKLEQDRDDLNHQLQKLAGKTPLDAFLDEAARVDPDALPLTIAHLEENLTALEEERGRLDQSIGSEETVLSGMNGSPRAADLGQDAEDLRARIRFDVEQYTRLRLASAILREGIDRYRQKAQGPVLERASILFAGLTLGSFERLRVDYDERDEPVLKGVRPGVGEAIGVEAMSVGAADQLYLALRLATIEADLDRREPLPLIVDDILIQFDNARAAATLDALAALSRRTQVLMFTHHEHLRDLAEARVPADVLVVHTLPGPGL
jgi:uncharacterized protein YhaN